MNKEILITGHKNPDTDSACAATTYAFLKNTLTTEGKKYKAILSGSLNRQTRYVFEKSEVSAPEIVSDLYPRVSSVTLRNFPEITPQSSIYEIIDTLHRNNLTLLPVLDKSKNLLGIISTHEVTTFLIQDNLKDRPLYQFNIDNIADVIPGDLFLQGSSDTFTAPIMVGAMPYEISIERIEKLGKAKPLLVTGLREELIQYAVRQKFPAIVLTGCEHHKPNIDLFEGYSGCCYISDTDTADTVRRLRLSVPIMTIMNGAPDSLASDDYFDDAKKKLLDSHYRGLPVMDGSKYTGIVSRRCFIDRPKTELILVDHNETAQSIPGADQANIIEIIDHHRLAADTTRAPIFIDVRPVGSTCTIVFNHYQQQSVFLPKSMALLLLSGILSDTLILKSPTTTELDKDAATLLANLADTTIESWGEELFANTASLKTDNYLTLLESDYKQYSEKDCRIGISQVEVINYADFPKYQEIISKALDELKRIKELNWAMVLVTNIVKEESILLVTEHNLYEKHLAYTRISEKCYSLPGILSRKKQLLPEILRVINEYSTNL